MGARLTMEQVAKLPDWVRVQVEAALQPDKPTEARTVDLTPEAQAGYEDGQEAAFQAEAASWLSDRGYGRRTPKAMQRHHGRRWQYHLHDPRGEGVLLDLLLLDSVAGRYIEIELKTATGRVDADQGTLLARGEGTLCRSMDALKAAVLAWEGVQTAPESQKHP